MLGVAIVFSRPRSGDSRPMGEYKTKVHIRVEVSQIYICKSELINIDLLLHSFHHTEEMEFEDLWADDIRSVIERKNARLCDLRFEHIWSAYRFVRERERERNMWKNSKISRSQCIELCWTWTLTFAIFWNNWTSFQVSTITCLTSPHGKYSEIGPGCHSVRAHPVWMRCLRWRCEFTTMYEYTPRAYVVRSSHDEYTVVKLI